MRIDERKWRRIISTAALVALGGVIVPVASWWYVPAFLWWYLRAMTQTVSTIWVLVLAVVLGAQMATLWSLPVGLLCIVMLLLLWSLSRVEQIKNRALRWSFEILHGFFTIIMMLGLSQAVTFEHVLLNGLFVLIVMSVIVIIGQKYGT